MPTLAAPLVMGLSSVGGAVSSANAAQAQGAYQKQVSDTNARIADTQAQEALDKGEQNANAVRRQANKVRSEQRAAGAAQGLGVDSGDIADLGTETQLTSAQDVKTAKTNAWLEAWGYKTQASNASAAGKFAEMSEDNKARNTILTGGMQALGYGLEAGSKKKTLPTKEIT